jgi:hypothetical protein
LRKRQAALVSATQMGSMVAADFARKPALKLVGETGYIWLRVGRLHQMAPR